MSVQVNKLQALLTLVQKRAKEPRSFAMAAVEDSHDPELEPVEVSTAVGAAVAAPLPDLDAPDLDEPDFDAPVLVEPELDEPELDEPELDIPTSYSDEGLDLDDVPAPESGSVSRDTMDRALEEAEDAAPLTPPPESGEEFARPHVPKAAGPTMEQLGSTISLEEGNPQDFELDAPDYDDEDDFEERTSQINKSDIAVLAARSSSADTLEAELPAVDVLQMRSPEAARQDLERLTLGDPTPIEARVSKRPALSTNAVDLISASRSFSPKSFAELLDASLSLK